MRMKPKINAKKPDRKTNSGKDPLQELKIKSDLNKRTQSSELGINQANHEHSDPVAPKNTAHTRLKTRLQPIYGGYRPVSLSFYYCNEI
jgi:hypothetical protein